MPHFTNIFHTLCTKLGIKDLERHMVLKYHSALHRYIQTEMEFLDISTHRTKDRAKMDNIRTTSTSRKKRWTPERQRKIPGSGATSMRALVITLLTVAQSNHWWPNSKPLNQMRILTPRQNQKGEDRSLMRNPVPLLLPPSSSLVNQTS
jgi:hypothetical protein